MSRRVLRFLPASILLLSAGPVAAGPTASSPAAAARAMPGLGPGAAGAHLPSAAGRSPATAAVGHPLRSGSGAAQPHAAHPARSGAPKSPGAPSPAVSGKSGVEIESLITPGILNATTTADKTVGPILREGNGKIPDFIKAMAGGGSPHQVKWSSLTYDQKVQLIKQVTGGLSFKHTRAIPGLVFKKHIAKPKEASFVFNGKYYAKGTDKVDISGFVVPKVQVMGPGHFGKGFAGVEWQVLKQGSAGRTVKDAFTFAKLLDSPATHAHQHITAPVPQEILGGDPRAINRAAQLYRCANMVGDLRAVLAGYPLKRRGKNGLVYTDFLKSQDLATVVSHLYSISGTEGTRLLGADDLKIRSVGWRGAATYGTTNDKLFGFELRTLNTKDQSRRELTNYVNTVQKKMLRGGRGLAEDALDDWYTRTMGSTSGAPKIELAKRQGEALSQLHYNRPVFSRRGQLSAGVPEELRGLTSQPRVQDNLRSWGERNYGLKMLVFDFNKDPLLAGNPKLLQRVRAAQRVGLQELGQLSPTELDRSWMIVKRFVKSSGLYGAYATALGMEPSVVKQVERTAPAGIREKFTKM